MHLLAMLITPALYLEDQTYADLHQSIRLIKLRLFHLFDFR